MRRHSEAVLNGHPDKFCDLLADRVVMAAMEVDPDAFVQIEVSAWSDTIWFNGVAMTRGDFRPDLKAIVRDLGYEIGLLPGTVFDADRYTVRDGISYHRGDSRKWTHQVNDQSIVIGYAGYDHLTRYLPPEHFAVWYFRMRLVQALCTDGPLAGAGPDGKVLLVMREYPGEWQLRTLLVTLQQDPSMDFRDHTARCREFLQTVWDEMRRADKRWQGEWNDIEVLVNPNGPLLNGGSDGDNGQTGRKLVMDFYGPRVPIGGGALYGKYPTNIDRAGAKSARELALVLCARGGGEVLVQVCYAPGMSEPLDVQIRCDNRFDPELLQRLHFDCVMANSQGEKPFYHLHSLGTFYGNLLSQSPINPGGPIRDR